MFIVCRWLGKLKRIRFGSCLQGAPTLMGKPGSTSDANSRPWLWGREVPLAKCGEMTLGSTVVVVASRRRWHGTQALKEIIRCFYRLERTASQSKVWTVA